jgi:hypothetical protein
MAGLIAAFMSNFAATVNAAPAYLVNDIYKRYINPNASQKRYVWLSYIVSFSVVVIGLTFGIFTQSINSVVQWIVSGLWGGYTASNVLKWYWWRFNSWGYFWGMVAGIGSSLALPLIMPLIIPQLQPFVESHFGSDAAQVMVLLGHPITSFPLILGLSLLGCFIATYLTKPEADEILKDFYRRVLPWGFWGTIREKVVQEDPGFQRNKDFFRDMFNIITGTIWQTCFIVLAMFLVTRHFQNALITLVVLVITCVILKKTWFDKLPPPTPDAAPEPQEPSGATKPAAG